MIQRSLPWCRSLKYCGPERFMEPSYIHSGDQIVHVASFAGTRKKGLLFGERLGTRLIKWHVASFAGTRKKGLLFREHLGRRLIKWHVASFAGTREKGLLFREHLGRRLIKWHVASFAGTREKGLLFSEHLGRRLIKWNSMTTHRQWVLVAIQEAVVQAHKVLPKHPGMIGHSCNAKLVQPPTMTNVVTIVIQCSIHYAFP